jgi:hypothetical protein
MFHCRQSWVQWSGMAAAILPSELDVKKWFLLVKDHQAICDASYCCHQNRDSNPSCLLGAPRVLSLPTHPPSPYICVPNRRVKTFHRFIVLYLCSADSTKTPTNLLGLDWTQLCWLCIRPPRLCWTLLVGAHPNEICETLRSLKNHVCTNFPKSLQATSVF